MSAFAPRRRLRAWWQSRQPAADALTLSHRNVYILPTRAGLMLAATLVVLLLASINYQLNLGYLLTFLLAGASVAGMHVGHATLRGLRLNLLPPEPQFAGRSAQLTVTLTNPARSACHGIGLAVHDDAQPRRWAWCDVPAQGSSTVQVGFLPPARGLHPLPALTAETRFPLGTFRVWTVWRPAAQLLVYPAPEAGAPTLPPAEPRPGGAPLRQSASGGDFDGVRGYRRGDPLKAVVWKKAAKAQELVSRDTQQAQRQELWLDAAATGLPDTERQLARLCAWVLQADRLGLAYGLRLPQHSVPTGSGEAHRRRCLEVLALC